MLTGSELALDRATIERSRNRETAVLAKAGLEGYKFIRLRLKNIRRKNIVGVDAIVAHEFVNESMGGITDYKIEVQGGEIKFEFRPEIGMYVFDLLDTERNREFLASHFAGDYWEIMDSRVNADVSKRAEIIAQRLRDGKPRLDAGPKEFWDGVRHAEEQQRRAQRGEIQVPQAMVAKENPLNPDVPITAPYEPPEPIKGLRSKPLGSAVKVGPDLSNGQKNVSCETTEPIGVGITQP